MILGLELEAVEGKISVGSNVPLIIHTVDSCHILITAGSF
jgi:hypothetical protein